MSDGNGPAVSLLNLIHPGFEFVRQQFPEMWIDFHDAGQIGQIFLPFAGTAYWIAGRPDLAQKHVPQTSHWQEQSQNLAGRCPFDKIIVANITMNLDPEI